MCSRGPGGLSGGDIQRTRPERPVTLKPSASSAALNSVFCSKQYPPRRLSTSFACTDGKVEIDRTPQQRVDALERDRIDVRGVKARERSEVGLDAPAKTDAGEIIIKTKFIRHDPLPK